MSTVKNKEYPSFDYDVCVACSVCVQICPVSCLELEDNILKKDKLTAYPILTNQDKCISCNFCEQACPVEAIKMISV